MVLWRELINLLGGVLVCQNIVEFEVVQCFVAVELGPALGESMGGSTCSIRDKDVMVGFNREYLTAESV